MITHLYPVITLVGYAIVLTHSLHKRNSIESFHGYQIVLPSKNRAVKRDTTNVVCTLSCAWFPGAMRTRLYVEASDRGCLESESGCPISHTIPFVNPCCCMSLRIESSSATHMPFRCADEINWNGEDLASLCCVGGVSEEDEDSVITKYGEVNSR